MYPELFRIGSLVIHSYGVMLALAVVIAAIALYREAPREKFNPDYILEAVVLVSFAGLLGARLLYIFLNWDYYSGQFFSAFFTRFEGLSFYGGLFGGAIVLIFWTRLRRIDFLRMADLLSPYLILGYAFGRIGCFLNGCCYGRAAAVPWALPGFLTDTVLRHPVQLYAAAGALIIFLILRFLRPRRPFVGFIFIALFAFYGLLRFITEFFRYGDAVLFQLTLAQLFSLGLLITSLAVIIYFGGGLAVFNGLIKLPVTSKKKRGKK